MAKMKLPNGSSAQSKLDEALASRGLKPGTKPNKKTFKKKVKK